MRRVVPLIFLVCGCGVRAAPYRFAGPMVSAVRLDDPTGTTAARRTGHEPVRAPMTELGGGFAERTGTTQDSGVVIAELPAPHLEPKPKKGTAAITLADVRAPDDLRALTGRRDGRDPVVFALALAISLGAPATEAADGPALVALADTRGALGDPSTPIAPGDLLVFDRAFDDAPASLIAVAIARDPRGVIEMIYLARGVVRRGFLDPARPHTKRDDDGRIVNTFLRHGTDHPPSGTKYLAAELLAHVIAAGKL